MSTINSFIKTLKRSTSKIFHKRRRNPPNFYYILPNITQQNTVEREKIVDTFNELNIKEGNISKVQDLQVNITFCRENTDYFHLMLNRTLKGTTNSILYLEYDNEITGMCFFYKNQEEIFIHLICVPDKWKDYGSVLLDKIKEISIKLHCYIEVYTLDTKFYHKNGFIISNFHQDGDSTIYTMQYTNQPKINKSTSRSSNSTRKIFTTSKR